MARIWGRREKERMGEGEDPDPRTIPYPKETKINIVQ
jgi:hypothetical protein